MTAPAGAVGVSLPCARQPTDRFGSVYREAAGRVPAGDRPDVDDRHPVSIRHRHPRATANLVASDCAEGA